MYGVYLTPKKKYYIILCERMLYYMKLLIAGSRSISEFDITPYIPEGTDHIISGGAAGVDALAEKYADDHKI